jgi:hypothetical protein
LGLLVEWICESGLDYLLFRTLVNDDGGSERGRANIVMIKLCFEPNDHGNDWPRFVLT